MFIEINDQFVEASIRSVFSQITAQIAGIQLAEPPARKKRIESPISVVILSKGSFKSKAIAIFPSEFVRKVVDRMSGGESLQKDEQDAYFKEFMNIFFGRFISKINNEIGRASRFVIPVLLPGTYKETAVQAYRNSLVTSFMSDFGRIEFTIKYELLPEHSSN